ncbi:hypothetical protein KBD34_04855 [Patescibacteria group bacterium]|nr:hypothetical protein [Patescibacteria group bacterium]
MPMLSARIQRQTLERQAQLSRLRRELQQCSAEVLSTSKRSIFALHREDSAASEKELKAAEQAIERGWKIIQEEALLAQEGSWRAAREEFAEASLLAEYLKKGSLQTHPDKDRDPDIFIGGLSDFLGELVRLAVLAATRGDRGPIERFYHDAIEIMDFLLLMDLTGHLRTKVDQAKQHVKKLEEIRYDLSLRSINQS